MQYKKKEDWIPADGLTLEDNALLTVKSENNTLVVAGPGAGKTELLAQRACYLLETNTCKFPRKILAISFKRDAAYNLKERVKIRCGENLSHRFDSITFDAFAKNLLDHFYKGLPVGYQIQKNYNVLLKEYLLIDEYKSKNEVFVNNTNKDTIHEIHNGKLPVELTDYTAELRKAVWDSMLLSSPSHLTFKMIMRLAELLVSCNPYVKRYLQQTYSHIFLDEFQDTTTMQYEFLRNCFEGSDCVYTAVGDDKQRIMLWAGAKSDVFSDYVEYYSAHTYCLQRNFRSAPKLVALQNYLIEHLLDKKDLVIASEKWDEDAGEALIWAYKDQGHEKKHLFLKVKEWIEKDGLNPRDICILVKQQLDYYGKDIIEYFNDNGINARNENDFQDLLTEPVVGFIINTLYHVCEKKMDVEKEEALNFLISLNSYIEDDQILKLERKFYKYIEKLRNEFTKDDPQDYTQTVQSIIEFADRNRIIASFSNYRNPKYLTECLSAIIALINSHIANKKSLKEALDLTVGKDSIPVMTIHKSKGLEYHTVVFVGLEDDAFWSFEKQSDEDKCAFFVALSRAKERVVFTYSQVRELRWGARRQDYKKIKVIFDQLISSGIVHTEVIPVLEE